MQHGVILSGTEIHGWVWSAPDERCPFEWPIQVGDRVVDLGALSIEEAHIVVPLLSAAHPDDRLPLVAAYPQVVVLVVPPPPTGHVVACQPGYRRIVHRPTKDWHDKEMLARVKSNGRIANGENEQVVIDEEFGHLSKEDKATRKGMKNGVPFPLTPRVRLVEQEQTLADGTKTVGAIRQFPFHEPVGEY